MINHAVGLEGYSVDMSYQLEKKDFVGLSC